MRGNDWWANLGVELVAGGVGVYRSTDESVEDRWEVVDRDGTHHGGPYGTREEAVKAAREAAQAGGEAEGRPEAPPPGREHDWMP